LLLGKRSSTPCKFTALMHKKVESVADEVCELCSQNVDLHCDDCGECYCDGSCTEDDEDDEESD